MNMIEKVARAVNPERWAAIDSMVLTKDSAMATLVAAEMIRARIAIARMMEPTDAMVEAVRARYRFEKPDPHDVTMDWQTMLEEILK